MTCSKRESRSSLPRMRPRRLSAALALFAVAVLAPLIATPAVQAQTFTVLHTFVGFPNDGRFAFGSLIQDSAGNIYGTTERAGKYGGGVIYKLDPAGNETIIYNFIKNKTGALTLAGLAMDSAGNFYGTAPFGGDGNCELGTNMCGVVFKVDPTGKETVLHRFQKPGAGGALPLGSVVLDSAGNIYGTTQDGGTGKFPGNGVVFELDPTGKDTVLHSFNGMDGSFPQSGLIRDSAGNLYGTTQDGGGNPLCSSCGTVFKVDPRGKRTILHAFSSGSDGDGSHPELANLVMDGAGNLYGTTLTGGDLSCPRGNGGCGVVFKIDTTGEETILYRFHGGTDGAYPYTAVALDSAGNVYGTASLGGDLTCGLNPVPQGCGVVFKLDANGTETVLYSFRGGADGNQPMSLIRDAAGNLYGTTLYGGAFLELCGDHGSPNPGCGVLFKIVP